MSVKCIALDLDGTTLCDSKQISSRTRKALEEAISRGIHVVVASGRCLESLPESITQIEGIEYAITSNGAALYRLKEGNCMRRFAIPTEAVKAIMKIAEPYHFAYEVFYDGKAYAEESFIANPTAYGIRPQSVAYIQTTRHPVSDIADFIQEHIEELDSLDLVIPDRSDYEEMERRLAAEVTGIYLTNSVSSRLEISSRESGKHAALEFLLQKLGIDKEEAAAFGDADNDREMLSFVKYGMAVENATPGCKAAAWKVVPDHMEDGVAVGIEELLNM